MHLTDEELQDLLECLPYEQAKAFIQQDQEYLLQLAEEITDMIIEDTFDDD